MLDQNQIYTACGRDYAGETHVDAQSGRPARGVAAHLADRLTRDDRATSQIPALADCVARARPAILAAIASREARARRKPSAGGASSGPWRHPAPQQERRWPLVRLAIVALSVIAAVIWGTS